MTRWKSMWRSGAIALAWWLTLPGYALAQKVVPGSEAAEPGGAMSYLLPYFLVILSVGLGVFLVCRPSHRRDRARPEDYTSLHPDGTPQ